MTAHDMEAYRPVLLKLAQQRRSSVANLEEEVFHNSDGMAMGDLSNLSVEDQAERGFDNYSKETTLALAENESAQLEDIDAAFVRIDNRTFGICEECDQDIPSNRLQLNPAARQCMECAHKAQQRDAASPGNL